jgi:hypothetical protein
MIPVHQIMPEALAVVLRDAPLTHDKVVFAWRTVVGPAVERVTAIELKGRILHVQARDASWRREIERSAGIVCTKLKTLLGDDVVRGLKVTIP